MAEAILPVPIMSGVAPATEASLDLALLRAGQLLLGRIVALSDDAATVAVKQGQLALLLDISTATEQAKPAVGAPVRLEVVAAPSADNPEISLTLKWLSANGQQAGVQQALLPSMTGPSGLPSVVASMPAAPALPRPAAPAPGAEMAAPQAVAGNAAPSAPLKMDRSAAPQDVPVDAAPREVLLPRVAAALTMQESPARLFADLAVAQDDDRLPLSLRAVIEQVLAVRASTGDLLRPETFLSAILRSGVFFERNLASGSASAMTETPRQLAGDLKSALLALKEALSSMGEQTTAPQLRETARSAEAPPPPLRGDWPKSTAPLPVSGERPDDPAETMQNLLSRTESALARLDLLQFASLNDAGSGEAPRSWVMEVPLAFGQETAMLGLRVEEDGRLDVPARERIWRIAFSLDSTGTGPVDALVTWRAGRVGVDLWAERGEAVRAIQDSVDQLAQGLARSGLAIDEIHCRTGRPASRRTGTGQLLDARS